MQKNIHINQLTNNAAEVFIYGHIGDDVISGDVIKAIRALEPLNATISFRINSGGGSIFEGLAIFNAIKNCKCKTIGYVDGLAASMGSVIAMACNEVYMSKYSMFMTHMAKGGINGNADQLRTYATVMDALELSMASIYANKAGLTLEVAQEKYVGSTDKWLTADEALADKLIDGIYDGELTIAPPLTMRTEKELCGFYASIYNLEKFTTNMKEIKLTAEQAAYLGATSNEPMHMQAVLDNLIGKAKKVDALEASLTATNTKLIEAEAKVKEVEAAGKLAEITTILKEGVDAKKMTVEMSTQLAVDYAEKPDELKKLVAALPVFASVVSAIANNKASSETLANKTWDEMDKDGTLEKCKADLPDVFKAKFKEKFGREYE